MCVWEFTLVRLAIVWIQSLWDELVSLPAVIEELISRKGLGVLTVYDSSLNISGIFFIESNFLKTWQPCLPYITQYIPIIDFFKNIFALTQFLIKFIKMNCCTNVVRSEGSYYLLKFWKSNSFQIHNFEMFENVFISKI